jgi:hypothetical protein
MVILNKSVSFIHWQEGVSKPALDSTDGELTTNLKDCSARIDVDAGSDTTWARVAVEGRTAKISVQAV